MSVHDATKKSKAQFHWDAPLLPDRQLTDDERMVRDAALAYCQDKLQPRVLEAFRHEQTDPAIFREMSEPGLLGPTIPEQYGGPGLNYVRYTYEGTHDIHALILERAQTVIQAFA